MIALMSEPELGYIVYFASSFKEVCCASSCSNVSHDISNLYYMCLIHLLYSENA
jgi:hypothetical protein